MTSWWTSTTHQGAQKYWLGRTGRVWKISAPQKCLENSIYRYSKYTAKNYCRKKWTNPCPPSQTPTKSLLIFHTPKKLKKKIGELYLSGCGLNKHLKLVIMRFSTLRIIRILNPIRERKKGPHPWDRISEWNHSTSEPYWCFLHAFTWQKQPETNPKSKSDLMWNLMNKNPVRKCTR